MNDNKLSSFLFVIDSSQKGLSDALGIIDGISEIENWKVILPDAAVLVSRKNINELNELIKSKIPENKYIITLLERGKKAGWLAKSSWEFMNKPTSVFDA